MGTTRAVDLNGKIFGNWTVLERSSKKTKGTASAYWKCQCICGVVKDVIAHGLVSGKSKSCGCKASEAIWKGHGEISGRYWYILKKGADQRVKCVFDITIEQAWELFLKQDRKCALTGLPIKFVRSYLGSEQTASLDRIDNTKGYTLDNIQWVHKDINWMKQDFDQDYFVQMCSLVGMHKAVQANGLAEGKF